MTTIFNPIAKTDNIHKEYFNFFLTSFSPNNKELQEKLKYLRNLKYLWREPFIAISKQYELGQPFENFETDKINDKVKLGFKNIKSLYKHQEDGIKNILNNRNTIISTGTGSGKTEIFLIPILNYCFENRDKKGVKAILVYPMNALANDQVERLRKALWFINQGFEKKITFAIYTGETPESVRELAEEFSGLEETHIVTSGDNDKEKDEKRRIGCETHCDKLKYDVENSQLKCRCGNLTIDYQLLTRSQIRDNPPDILITNYVQLEHLLLRKKDEKIFSDGNVRFIVFDEIHAYSGARGIDVALLNRRLQSRLRKYNNPEPIDIGTSATISTLRDETERKERIAHFAERMFGVEFSKNDVIEGKERTFKFGEPYKMDIVKKIPHVDVESIEYLDNKRFSEICETICPTIDKNEIEKLEKDKWSVKLGEIIVRNPFFQLLMDVLKEPSDFDEIFRKIEDNPIYKRTMNSISNDSSKMKEIIWSYLKAASLASHPELSSDEEKVPLIRVNVHNFFRTVDRIYQCNGCGELYIQPKNSCDECKNSVDELGVCRFCGKEFIISTVVTRDLLEYHNRKIGGKRSEESKIIYAHGGDIAKEKIKLKKLEYSDEYSGEGLPLWQSFSKGNGGILAKKCILCGSILDVDDSICTFCDSSNLKDIFVYIRENLKERYDSEDISEKTQPHHCPFCNNSYGRFSALSPMSMSSNTAAVTLFDIIYTILPENLRKLLIFTDNRQAASYLAGYLEDGHLDHALRNLIYNIIRQNNHRILFHDLREKVLDEIVNWFGGRLEPEKRREIDKKILLELTSQTGRQRSIENLGLIETVYKGLETLEEFKTFLENSNSTHFPIPLSDDEKIELFRKYLISLLNIIRTYGTIEGLHYGYGRDPVIGFIEEEKTRYVPPGYTNVIQLRGILSTHPLVKTFQLTRDTFNTEDKKTIKNILGFSFKILRENNLVIPIVLKKWGKHANGYVISSNKTIVKIPKEVFICNKCKRAYTNLPEGVCATYRCDGKPKKIKYETFLEESENYYVNLYRKFIPIKMLTAEDTGALKPRDRRPIETEFKKEEFKGRKVDVIVATPTLELGVDIGDLISIGLFKAPPSPANYLQRVGRAGRTEKISFNNTFLFLTPIDKFYFRQPQKLIKGEVETPAIKLENYHLLQRHINSLILEELFIHSSKAEEYEKSGAYDMYIFVFDNFFEKLKEEVSSKKEKLIERISLTLRDLQFDWVTDELINKMIEEFVTMLDKSVERYKEKLRWYESKRDELNELLKKRQLSPDIKRDARKRWLEVTEEIDKLKEKTNIISYLMDTNVLPRYAFPGIFVDINDVYGLEDFSGRARNYAITEYAPNMEVYLKKAIYKSIGIDFEFIRPIPKLFYICPTCQKFITEDESSLKNGCPICKSKLVEKQTEVQFIRNAIEPNIIYVKKTNKPLNEPRDYQEVISNIFFSEVPKAEPPKSSSIEPNIKITKYGNINLLIIVSDIDINGELFPIELCEKCGKVKEPNEREYDKHYKLGSQKREKCDGRYRRLSLYHKMPTNVISIKFKGETFFGIDKEILINEWKNYKPNLSEEQLWHIFLITFKNAIINAAQRVLQTEDGEIEGEVKDNEIILYDNVDGGVGYVDEIVDRFDEILKEAVEMVLDTDDKCDTGCLDCLWSYRRKRDIRFIDKRFVKDIFKILNKSYTEREISKEGKVKKNFIGYEGRNIKTIHSPPYNFLGVIELKKLLKSAKEEIILTSLYVTDSPIPWPDEREKSWVDILTDIKLSSPTLKMTIIVREPVSKDHLDALKKLCKCGITVKLFKKEIETMLPSIIHSKLIVIDPHIPSRRYAIHTSANFSPEMWKNHETFDLGNDEKWVKGTYKEIKKLAKQSLDLKDD